MRVRNGGGVLPRVKYVIHNSIHANSVPDLREKKRPAAAHRARIAIHDGQIRAHRRRKVGLVDDEEVGLRDAGAAFARDFIAARDVDDLNGEIGEFAAEMRGEIVATGFNQHEFGMELTMQFFEGEQVGGNVFTDRRVGAAAGFDGADAFRGQRVVADEEFAVFLGENIVGHGGDVYAFA